MRRRTRARRLALEVLYQVDLLGPGSMEEALAAGADRLDDASRKFAHDLVHGVLQQRDQIDARLSEIAENWDLHRMATIDRNVLRLGAYELIFREDIPPKVAINEAVELAKRYSTAESGNFVNGILDHIKSTLDPSRNVEPDDKDQEE